MNFVNDDLQSASFDVSGNFTINYAFTSMYNSNTMYENQFVGDIWSEKGVTCKNGLFIQNFIGTGATTYAVIDNGGNAAFKNCSTTASAKDIATYTTNNSLSTGYIKLYPNTALASFNPLVKNNDCLILSDGPTGSGLTIGRATTNATGFRLDSSTLKFAASGAVQFWLSNAPSGTYSGFDSLGTMVLQDGLNVGGVTMIDSLGAISGPSANITTITTTTQATADNSTKVATTAFIKNQNYISTTSSNTFTATNTFQSTVANATPFLVKSTRTSPNPQLSICVDTTATAYNPIVQAGDAIIFTDNTPGIVIGLHTSAYSGFRCDGLTTTLYGKSTLATYIWDKGITTPAFQYNATNNVSNSRLDCTTGLTVAGGPITPAATSVATTSSHMGFQITPTITTPSGNAVNQLASVIFDNATNNAYGTYLFEYHLTISTTTALSIASALTTTVGSIIGNYADNRYSPAVTFPNTFNQSAVIRIYTTQTWYLNLHIPSGTYTYSNGLFRITRIA